MMKVYKIPVQINPDEIKLFVGLKGSLLNPVENKSNGWVISIQEWDDPQFDNFKSQYSEFIPLFILVDFIK